MARRLAELWGLVALAVVALAQEMIQRQQMERQILAVAAAVVVLPLEEVQVEMAEAALLLCVIWAHRQQQAAR